MTTQTLKNWKEFKFKDFVKLQRGFDLPKQDRRDGIYPVIASTSITGYHDKYKAEPPCVTTGRSGALGEVLYIKEKCWPLNTALWVKDFKGNNPYFVYNLLKTLHLEQYNSGAGVPTLNRNHLDQIKVGVPDITAQESIADILSTYDDLIENNTRRIKILEQMAQAIYTEWFVNFRFPGHKKVNMIDSKTEFDKIPEGWNVVSMGDIADFINGYAFKPNHLGSEGLPVIKIPELRSGVLEKTPRNSGELIPKKYLIKTGDILFSWSATLLVNIWNSEDGLLNQHLFKVTPKENYLYSFIFHLLTNQIEKYRAHAVGATMQHLRRDVVESAKVLLPNKDLLLKFDDIVSIILKERSNLIIQNQKLRQTRDSLLPKLVTGEIRV